MYFTGASLEIAKELEQTLGRYQFEDDKKRTVIRPLMTNDEIRTMSANRALLICGYHPPIIGRLRPYYKNSIYNGYSKIPAPEIENSELPERVAILPMNIPDREKDE